MNKAEKIKLDGLIKEFEDIEQFYRDKYIYHIGNRITQIDVINEIKTEIELYRRLSCEFRAFKNNDKTKNVETKILYGEWYGK